MSAEVNIPDEAIAAGWHEFRYPRPATDEPSAAFLRGLRAAAPLVVAPYESKLTAVWALAERAERKGYDLDAAEVLAALRGESR